MKMKAAVAREGRPISVEEVELAPPKEKEVLVKTKYTGFCHSDHTAARGGFGFPLPMVIGHEASGIVEDVGPGVTSIKQGDAVVTTWMIACGECARCTSGRGHICTVTQGIQIKGGLLDGTSRLTDSKGNRVSHQTFVSGMAEYMVIPEQGAIKVRDGFPLDQACLMGCCVPTALGAVNNVANIRPGDSVAIWGMGGVGLNVVRSAKLRGADPLIGIDIEGSKETIAREFGVTHFIDSSKEDPVPAVQELTGGGADFCFEVVGDPGALVQAYWALSIGGSLIMIGMPSLDDRPPLPLMFTPAHNRNVLGTLYGNVRARVDLPKFMDMVMKGGYADLNKLITRHFKIEQINDVYDAMTEHRIMGRWICVWD